MIDGAIDIVISTCNGGSRIGVAIESISRSTHSYFTLWVLDQSADDLTERSVLPFAASDPRIRYVRVPQRGIAATRNYGATLGTANHLLFTNDDCYIDPNWVAAIIREFSQERTDMVFGRVLPDTRARLSGGQVLATKLSLQRVVYERGRFDLSFGHGHNMGVRRDQFIRLGGFDELLGQGQSGPLGSWEDRDLGYRLLRHGGRIVYCPEAVVEHRHWQNWEQVGRRYRDYGIGTGAAVAKYVRCGDPAAIILLFEWMFSQGVQQTLSGIIKWRNMNKIRIGMMQLVYPWIGLMRGFRYRCSDERYSTICSP